MNKEEFIKNFVNIDKNEEVGQFEHYPFQMVSVGKDEKLKVFALAIGGNVEDYYEVFKKELDNDPLKLYMSIDFPSMFDMKKDFVMVFSVNNGRFKACAIPYNNATGKKSKEVNKSAATERIFNQFLDVVRPEQVEKKPRIFRRKADALKDKK